MGGYSKRNYTLHEIALVLSYKQSTNIYCNCPLFVIELPLIQAFFYRETSQDVLFILLLSQNGLKFSQLALRDETTITSTQTQITVFIRFSAVFQIGALPQISASSETLNFDKRPSSD